MRLALIPIRRPRRALFCLLVLIVVAGPVGCVMQQPTTFSDPIAYCRAIRTIDHPDARYIGPHLPGWIAKRLHVQPDESDQVHWRCDHRKVMACFDGANMPCTSRANNDRTPTLALRDYCREHPESSFVPMVITGHDTAVSWSCHKASPVAGATGAEDAQGYEKAYWQQVTP